jgi:hypothetical protein
MASDGAGTTAEVYAQFTEAPEDYDFSKTVAPMRPARFGDEQLVSRPQAKRLIARFQIQSRDLGFSDVQAFADDCSRCMAFLDIAIHSK